MEEKAPKGRRPPQSDVQEPAKKKRFRVWAKSTHDHYIDLYATSAKEAEKLAEDIDDFKFREDPFWDYEWHIDDVNEVDADNPFDPISPEAANS